MIASTEPQKRGCTVPIRSLAETMTALEPILDDLDQIARLAHAKYRAYGADVLLELDARAQAACTYAHMSARPIVDSSGALACAISMSAGCAFGSLKTRTPSFV